MPDIDPYKILQVDSEAEDEVIQAAYRRLARKYHPDLATTPDAASRMAAINAAWELIGEPAKRQAYDRKREVLKTTPTSAPSGTGRHAPSGGAAAAGRRPAGAARRLRERGAAASSSAGAKPSSGSAPQPETVSRDWTSGRSTQGSGYEESMHSADGFGAAGPPPGRPSGTVLNFGRYAGWSLGEVARTDIEYIEWLDRAPIGRNYRQEIDEILRKSGRRVSADAARDRAPRAVPPTLIGAALAGAVAAGAVGPAAVGPAVPIVRSTTQPTVVPWTSSVNRTTPKVISWSSARCGMSAGQGERHRHGHRPAQTGPEQDVEPPAREWFGQARAASQSRRSTEQHVDHDARDRSRMPAIPQAIGPSDSRRRPGGMASPTSRKTTAVSR